jgi:BASS family bile acid:Na+ symporter
VTITQLISLGIQVSMGLMVFCVGLHARAEDIVYLLRKPGQLVRSLVAMNVIMPAVAVTIALAFPSLDRSLRVALIALSVAPIPPILPGTQLKAGGRSSYVVGLLAIAALVSIVTVPVTAAFIGRIFGQEVNTDAAAIAWIVGTSLLGPIVAGIVVERFAPAFAERIGRPLSLFATALLVVSFLPVLLKIWPAIVASFGNFTLLTIGVFVAIGLAVGHLLGGPAREDRSVLALATASRHPGVALAVAHDTASLMSVLGIVLVCLIVGALFGAVYTKWIARI